MYSIIKWRHVIILRLSTDWQDGYETYQMPTPMKNAVLSMCTIWYIQQEISNILSMSQSGISKIFKRYKETDALEKLMSEGIERYFDV